MAIDPIGFEEFTALEVEPFADTDINNPQMQTTIDACSHRGNVRIGPDAEKEIATCAFLGDWIKSKVGLDRTNCARCILTGTPSTDNRYLHKCACEAMFARLAPRHGTDGIPPHEGEIDKCVENAKTIRGDMIAKRFIDSMYVRGTIKTAEEAVALLEKHGLDDLQAIP